MHPDRAVPAFFSAALALAAAAAAQAPDAAAPVAVVECTGVLCAVTPSWSATFAADAVEFTAVPGRSARPAPTLRLTAVAVGRERGPSAALLPAEPRDDDGGSIVRYTRAAGVEEAWHARAGGVELTYELAAPLPGDGDLVVRLRLDGDLREVAGDGSRDDLQLGSAATAPFGVRIGAVTGVAADGRRVAGSRRLRDGELELRLPAAFVDGARYPLVLDPLIGPAFLVSSGADDSVGDVAWDEASQRYLVVWQRDVALGNSDVLGQLLDASGAPVGAAFTIADVRGGLAFRPTVASVRLRSRFLVMWRNTNGLFQLPWLACRCVNPDGALSTSAAIQSAVPSDEEAGGPLLGGNATTTDDGVLAVWSSRLSGVFAVRVAVPAGTAAPVPGGTVAIAAGSFYFPTGLACTSTCGAVGRWVVAWTVQDLAVSRFQARAIGLAGNPIGTELEAQPQGSTAHSPAIDGNGTSFLLAWGEAGEIRCRGLAWSGSDLALQGTEQALTASGSVKSDTAVAWLGPKYAVAWSDDGGALLQNDVRGITVDPATCLPCGVEFTIARPGRFDFAPRFAPQATASPLGGDEALLVFSSAALALPYDGEIVAQRLEAIGAGGGLQGQGGGCGGSWTAGADGPIAIGNGALSFHIGPMTGVAAAYLNVTLPGAPPIVCGPCRIAPPFVLVPSLLRNDTAINRLGLPCDPALIGGQLDLQWWLVGPAGGCPLVATVGFSDVYRLTIGE